MNGHVQVFIVRISVLKPIWHGNFVSVLATDELLAYRCRIRGFCSFEAIPIVCQTLVLGLMCSIFQTLLVSNVQKLDGQGRLCGGDCTVRSIDSLKQPRIMLQKLLATEGGNNTRMKRGMGRLPCSPHRYLFGNSRRNHTDTVSRVSVSYLAHTVSILGAYTFDPTVSHFSSIFGLRL